MIPPFSASTSRKNRCTEIVRNELNLIVLLDFTVTPGGPDLIDDHGANSVLSVIIIDNERNFVI